MKIMLIFFLLIIKIYSADIYPRELDIKDAKLSDVVAELSKYSKKTIISDKNLKDENVNIYFKEKTSLEEILNTLILAYGLKKIEIKNIILLKRKNIIDDNYLMGKIKNNNLGIENVKIKLRRGKEDHSFISGNHGEFLIENLDTGVYYLSIVSNKYTYNGKFIEIKKGSNIFDISLQSSVNKNDIRGEENNQKNKKNAIIENISLENIDEREVKSILKEVFQKDLIISSNKMNNSIILYGDIKFVLEAKKLIKKLDEKIKQVKISAKVIDIKESKVKDLGLNFNINSQGTGDKKSSGIVTGLLGDSYIDGIGEVLGSSINFVSKFNNGNTVLDLNLKLLEATQDLKITALPSVIVLSGKEGKLKTVEEVIVGEKKEENTENDEINYEPIFKEAGVILKVTPQIKNKENIYLDIKLEVSDFKLKRTFKKNEEKENDGTFNSEGGSKVSRSLESKVRVQNNEIIFIGGLKRTMDANIKSKVPVIGDIPVVGNLFKSSSVRKENTILYIRLKAEIIEEN